MYRWTIPSLAAALTLIVNLPSSSSAQATAQVRVRCDGGRYFLLQLDFQRATVIAGKRRFEMRRKESSLGRYYRGDKATLIIDGNFVAFVPSDDWDWHNCRLERPPEASDPR